MRLVRARQEWCTKDGDLVMVEGAVVGISKHSVLQEIRASVINRRGSVMPQDGQICKHDCKLKHGGLGCMLYPVDKSCHSGYGC